MDALTNRGEVGVVSALSYKITSQLNVGIQYCYGLTKVYTSTGIINSEEYSFEAWNKFAQLKFELFLK
ncbi:MAG: hypothetical protein KF860_14670 [Cyclobacteriaceae bacterium]|nr:hypothetical protein [Cyclobacteriaceae bacterium]